MLLCPVHAQQVSFDRVLHADREPQNWLSYSGTVFNQRHSLLTQITPANVKNLELQWVWQAKSLEKFEATALAVDGVLYTLQGPPVQGRYQVVALDAVSGRPFWTFEYQPAIEARPCCGRVSRGLAILGDTLFMGTIDAHLIAIDAKTGSVLWNIEAAKLGEKTTDKYAITHAPLVVKDKVIVGLAGGDLGVRGYIAAFDAKTGKEAVALLHHSRTPARRATTPGRAIRGRPAAPASGTAAPTIADANLVYFGTGNPAPDWDGHSRLGDNLYSDSVVALDADTGKLKWHYQFTPHDEVDYDSTQVPILVDMEWQGRPRKVMLWANRNGLAYVLDRVTGEFLLGKPYVRVNWMEGFDRNGRPQRVPGKIPDQGRRTDHAHRPRRDQLGAAVLQPANRPLLCVGLGEHRHRCRRRSVSTGCRGRRHRRHADGPGHADAQLEERRGRVRRHPRARSEDARQEVGIQDERHHVGRRPHDGVGSALQRRQGRVFLRARRPHRQPALEGCRSAVRSTAGPMSYSVNGKQYVTVAAGNALFAFALPVKGLQRTTKGIDTKAAIPDNQFRNSSGAGKRGLR